MTDTMTRRVIQLIDEYPEVDIYHAIDLAQAEVEAEQGAGHMALPVGVLAQLIIFVFFIGVLS